MVGEAPLSPIQLWWAEQELAQPHHWNQAVMLESSEPVAPRALARAVERILEHHDALRLRLRRRPRQLQGEVAEAGGTWLQQFAAPGGNPPFLHVDLADLPPENRAAAVAPICEAVQASLDLHRGPVVRFVLFDSGAEAGAKLLIVAHHLAVDGVSWRLILEDLANAYGQAKAGGEIELPPKTDSFLAWSEHLSRAAAGEEIRAESAYWGARPWAEAGHLPLDFPDGDNSQASSRVLSTELGREATETLLGRGQQVGETSGIDALLLTALAGAAAGRLGGASLAVDLEGHGRSLDGELDLSRTAGWFTSFFPLLLPAGQEDDDPSRLLRCVRERLREVPRGGRGYGPARFLGPPEVSRPLERLPRPAVVLNYLGQLDRTLPPDAAFRPAAAATGRGRGPDNRRWYALEINARVSQGRLKVGWTYSENLHRRSTVEDLAGRFLDVLEKLLAMPHGADFPLVRRRAGLEALLARGDAFDDVYPLSPTQEGMLSKSLQEGREAGTYISQLTCVLETSLEAQALDQCWRRLLGMHPILRTAFSWEDPEELLQVVYSRTDPRVTVESWEGLGTQEQEERFRSFLSADRRRGFDLSRAPLARLTLFRLAPGRYRCAWSFHHLVLDGWSSSALLRDFLALCQEALDGRPAELPRRPPFRDYVAWLVGRDTASAKRFWRQQLEGFAEPTPLPAGRGGGGGDGDGGDGDDGGGGAGAGERSLRLSGKVARELDDFARRYRLTANTLFQSAWALVLSHLCERPEVLFGTTASGRPPELDGVEDMLGLFIVTLPLRVRLEDEPLTYAWMRRLQGANLEIRRHGTLSPRDIARRSDVPTGRPLFSSLLLFQNYPVDRGLADKAPGLRLRDPKVESRSDYPLTVRVTPGAEPLFEVLFSDGGASLAERVIRLLPEALGLLIGFPEESPIELTKRLAAVERESRAGDRRKLRRANLAKLRRSRRHD